MQTYWEKIFVLPKRILKLIEGICITYLWTGSTLSSRKALVSWEKLCLSKGCRGQNIINLQVWNIAALLKLLWAMHEKKDCLWIKRIHIYYIKGEDVEHCTIPPNATWVKYERS